MSTRSAILQKLFSDPTGKRIAFIGIGGGGDVVSTVPLCLELAQLGATTFPGGLTWKRRSHDPSGRPRTIAEFSGVTAVGRYAATGDASTKTVEGIRHVEAEVSNTLGNIPVIMIDPSDGSAAVAEAFSDLERSLQLDEIIGVDAGGDLLCYSNEPGLESPLCDQTLLWALSQRHGRVFLASLGTDGEISAEEFISRFEMVSARGGYLGALEPDQSVLGRWGDVVCSASTESSKFALGKYRELSLERVSQIRTLLNSSSPELVPLLQSKTYLPLRNDQRKGFLCELTPFYLAFNARDIWLSGGFSAFWDEGASLRELHEILSARGIVTEFATQSSD